MIVVTFGETENEYFDARYYKPRYADSYLVKTEYNVYCIAHFDSEEWHHLGDSPGGEIAFFTSIPTTDESW